MAKARSLLTRGDEWANHIWALRVFFLTAPKMIKTINRLLDTYAILLTCSTSTTKAGPFLLPLQRQRRNGLRW